MSTVAAMRIGLLAGGGPKTTVDDIVGQVRSAADDGFSSAWLSQIFSWDALTALAVAGREVPGIELGTAVIPTYPRHPMVLAAQALTMEVDGRPLDLPGDEVLLVGVGNGSCIGGGTPLFPGARGDDGLLDVVVSCATGPAARAAFALALRKGTHLERDDVVAARGTTARISGDAMGLDADGELSDPVTDRTWTLTPSAWSLVM